MKHIRRQGTLNIANVIVEKIVDVVYPGQVPDGALGVGYVILSTIHCRVYASFGELPSSGFNFNGLVCGEEVEDEQREAD